MLIVRDANADDLPAMIQLERSSPTAAHWTAHQYRQLLTDQGPARLGLIAQESTAPTLLGFLIARRLPSEWELENLVVEPDARRQGIGARLLQELLHRAQQDRGEAVFLEVRDSNVAARRLYEKLGFTENGRRGAYYSNPIEDAVLYSKLLAQTISE